MRSAPADGQQSGGTRSGRAERSHLPRVSPWLPRVRLANDAYDFWIHPGHRTDEQYTNGALFSIEALRGTFWGAWLAPHTPDCGADTSHDGRCLTTTLAIGQDMYTPNLQRPPFSSPNWEQERPYAGWLFVSATGRSASRRSLRTVEATVGVTGKPALGQVSQEIAHWINQKYTTRATGWETQVGFQPGLQLGYEHALLAARASVGSKAFFDLAPMGAVTLGTVRTMASAGAQARFGYNLSHPWDPRVSRARTPLEYYVSAAGHGAYVARDFSLDGSLLDDSRKVERVPTQREYLFGAGLRMHRLHLRWEAITRSREYETGPARHAYSTMSASWEFYR